MVESAAQDNGVADVDANVRLVVRMLLAREGRTVGWLGEQLGIGHGTIYRKAGGEAPFTVAEVYRMSQLFKVAVSEFYEPTALPARPSLIGRYAARSRPRSDYCLAA